MAEKSIIGEFQEILNLIISDSIDNIVQYVEALYLKDLDHLEAEKQGKMFENILLEYMDR